MSGKEQPWVPLRLVQDSGCSKWQPLPAGGRAALFSKVGSHLTLAAWRGTGVACAGRELLPAEHWPLTLLLGERSTSSGWSLHISSRYLP